MAIRPSRGQVRTVANGGGRLRDVEPTHPQPPGPQSEPGTLATHSGKSVPGRCVKGTIAALLVSPCVGLRTLSYLKAMP